MPPIPHVQKKKPQARTTSVSTDNVYDNLGKSMSQLLRNQSYNNATQSGNIKTVSQNARKGSSDGASSIIFRDVFPGIMYRIHLAGTSWISDDSHLLVGYSVNNTFTMLEEHTEPPEDNLIELQLPHVDAIDYMEIRIPSGRTLQAYLEDTADAAEVWETIDDLLRRIEELERITQDHEERISALEDK